MFLTISVPIAVLPHDSPHEFHAVTVSFGRKSHLRTQFSYGYGYGTCNYGHCKFAAIRLRPHDKKSHAVVHYVRACDRCTSTGDILNDSALRSPPAIEQQFKQPT